MGSNTPDARKARAADFGGVLGGQNGRNIEILGVFRDVLFETLILVKFCLIFDEIAGEKHISFWLFLVSFLVFVLTFETFKIVLPSRRELKFYKIAFFALVEKKAPKVGRKGPKNR